MAIAHLDKSTEVSRALQVSLTINLFDRPANLPT